MHSSNFFSRLFSFSRFFLFSMIRWFECQYSPIVLRQSPTPKSVDDDKLWSDLPRRLSSSSSDACNSTVSSLCVFRRKQHGLLQSIRFESMRCDVMSCHATTPPGTTAKGPTRSRARAFRGSCLALTRPLEEGSHLLTELIPQKSTPETVNSHSRFHTILTMCVAPLALSHYHFAFCYTRIHWGIRNH